MPRFLNWLGSVFHKGGAWTQTYSTATHTHAQPALSESLTLANLAAAEAELEAHAVAINECKKLINGLIDDMQAAKISS